MQDVNKQYNENKSWLILIAIGLGVFMAMLDVTIVNVALPTIQREFNMSYVSTQWVVSAYTMTYSVSILAISKLGDVYGKKLFFLLSMSVFTIGSLMCALAPNSLFLNISRGIEGIGGAGMLGLSMALIGDNYSGKQRTFILGIWGSIVGFATSIGPLVGGILVQYFAWRSVFFVNVPVGIIAIFIGIRYIQEKHYIVDRHLDILGMILSTTTLFCIIYGLVSKENNIQDSWFNIHIISWIIIGIILLITFIIWELHFPYPMMNLKLFKKNTFIGACLAAFTISMGLYAFFTYLTILMQDYMGYSPLEVGAQRLLLSIFSIILGPLMGYVIGKVGDRIVIVLSSLTCAIGIIVMHYMLGFHLNWIYLIPSFIILGIGSACINPAISNSALLGINPNNMGMASGINNVCRQFGNCFGVVIIGLIIDHGYKKSLFNSLGYHSLAKNIINAGPFSGTIIAHKLKHIIPNIKTDIYHAYYIGFHNLLWLSFISFIILAIVCWFLFKNEKIKIKK